MRFVLSMQIVKGAIYLSKFFFWGGGGQFVLFSEHNYKTLLLNIQKLIYVGLDLVLRITFTQQNFY